ncbi:ABC transporter permease [Sinanaerobacter chloroacetimidivorans]|uniref:ABC transporter permease n=1 Tax=Sinanaerobacter chloroacetimidivorans TaxID=2818044 RepID=A0A8J8B203_9FIRM|nr:ABC transporter permease [Sinanaerobacter chloroacetimidivorans]MBR0599258.1 ABC transporter permease [Sinanaerobacter chloroacetimidivorans]
MNKITKVSLSSSFKKIVLKQEFSSMLILLVMFAVTAILQDNFFERGSVVRNINAFVPLILLAMGQAVVIISGGLDLSAGAALSLLTCVLTYIMKQDSPVTGAYALVIAFAVAVLIGVINGIGIGYLRIPPVIITFATSYIWLGAALFIRPTPGGESVKWFKIFYDAKAAEGVPGFVQAIGSVLQPALGLLIVGCLFWYFISKTKTGRYIYAVGSNNDSAYSTGINTAKVQMMACIINSVFIFLAALFFVGQNQSGDARMGDPMTLKAIAAAVVGGIALTGGRGSVYMAIVGALILSFVNKIIFFANIPNAYQTLVSGLIIIVAISGSMAYSHINKKAMLKEKE